MIPVLTYPDVRQAVDWLCTTFGFVEQVWIGDNHRAQLGVGDGAVIIGDVHGDRTPPRVGELTHAVMVRVDDVDAHFRHAKQSGAVVVAEPSDLPFGERQYSVLDPWQHQWTFSQTIADVEPEEWGGVTVATRG